MQQGCRGVVEKCVEKLGCFVQEGWLGLFFFFEPWEVVCLIRFPNWASEGEEREGQAKRDRRRHHGI